MNKFTSMLTNSIPKGIKKHGPEILTGLGISGMIITVVSAVKQTPKALRMIDEKEIKGGERLSKSEIVKTTWKCYLPSAITGICSIACIIGAGSMNSKRNAALAAAYAISVQDLIDYKKKTLEVVGDKKETVIRDEIAKEHAVRDNIGSMAVVHTGKGTVPCYDYLTKKLFESDMETLRKAENNLNERLREEQIITLNEFFYEIGMDGADESIGETLGWDIDYGYIEFNYTSILIDGVPYLVLGHKNPPRYIKRY